METERLQKEKQEREEARNAKLRMETSDDHTREQANTEAEARYQAGKEAKKHGKTITIWRQEPFGEVGPQSSAILPNMEKRFDESKDDDDPPLISLAWASPVTGRRKVAADWNAAVAEIQREFRPALRELCPQCGAGAGGDDCPTCKGTGWIPAPSSLNVTNSVMVYMQEYFCTVSPDDEEAPEPPEREKPTMRKQIALMLEQLEQDPLTAPQAIAKALLYIADCFYIANPPMDPETEKELFRRSSTEDDTDEKESREDMRLRMVREHASSKATVYTPPPPEVEREIQSAVAAASRQHKFTFFASDLNLIGKARLLCLVCHQPKEAPAAYGGKRGAMTTDEPRRPRSADLPTEHEIIAGRAREASLIAENERTAATFHAVLLDQLQRRMSDELDTRRRKGVGSENAHAQGSGKHIDISDPRGGMDRRTNQRDPAVRRKNA